MRSRTKWAAVRNLTRNQVLGDRIRVADSVWSRLKGLLGSPEPEAGEGLLIVPSRAVHMFGMRYPIDVLLLDATARVVGAYPRLQPGERTRVHRRARVAVELPAGSIDRTGTREGDELEWELRAEPPADRTLLAHEGTEHAARLRA